MENSDNSRVHRAGETSHKAAALTVYTHRQISVTVFDATPFITSWIDRPAH